MSSYVACAYLDAGSSSAVDLIVNGRCSTSPSHPPRAMARHMGAPLSQPGVGVSDGLARRAILTWWRGLTSNFSDRCRSCSRNVGSACARSQRGRASTCRTFRGCFAILGGAQARILPDGSRLHSSYRLTSSPSTALRACMTRSQQTLHSATSSTTGSSRRVGVNAHVIRRRGRRRAFPRGDDRRRARGWLEARPD